jgi:hypothetical protein
LIYAGHDEENATRSKEVELMLSPKVQKAHKACGHAGPRIIRATFKTTQVLEKQMHSNEVCC